MTLREVVYIGVCITFVILVFIEVCILLMEYFVFLWTWAIWIVSPIARLEFIVCLHIIITLIIACIVMPKRTPIQT